MPPPKAAKKKSLLDDDDEEEDAGLDFGINEEYARRFEVRARLRRT